MDIIEAHGGAVANTAGIARGVADDRWDAQSACAEWTVRHVLNHLVAENLWVPELVAGKTIADVGDRYEGDVLGDDPAATFERTGQSSTEAFAQPGALQRDIAVSYGPIPGEVYAGHHFLDLLVHGWDIAKGTGQDTSLPPDLVEFALGLVEPQLEFIQGSGAFEVIDVPSDASPQVRLLAMLGRRE